MKQFAWIDITEEIECRIHITNFDKRNLQTARDDINRRLIAKQGNNNTWHFALYPNEPRYPCDDDFYKRDNKGPWHRNWQSYSPPTHLEIYKRVRKDDGSEIVHIADMIDKYGKVVEFQHSVIKFEDVKSREETYENMYWVVDATSDKVRFILLADGRVLIKEYASWWEYLTKSIFLDIGIGVAYMNKRLYHQNLKYYLCTVYRYEQFINHFFELKIPFSLLPEHQGKYIIPNVSYICSTVEETVNKLVLSIVYDERQSDISNDLWKFGFKFGELKIYNKEYDNHDDVDTQSVQETNANWPIDGFSRLNDIFYKDLDSTNKKIVTKHLKIAGEIKMLWDINSWLISQIHERKSICKKRSMKNVNIDNIYQILNSSGNKYEPIDSITKHYYNKYLYKGKEELASNDTFTGSFRMYLEEVLTRELITKRFNYIAVYSWGGEFPDELKYSDFDKNEWILSEGLQMSPNDIQIMKKYRKFFLMFVDKCVNILYNYFEKDERFSYMYIDAKKEFNRLVKVMIPP